MKLIFKYFKPYRKKLLLNAVLHAAATLSSLMMPYVMSLIVDEGIKNKSATAIAICATVMLALAFISLATGILSNRISAKVTTDLTYSIQCSVFKKINSLSTEQYSKIGASGLLTRSTDDIFNLEGAASGLVYTLVTVPIMLIGGTFLSFTQDVFLSFVFIISVPPVLLIVIFLVKPLVRLWDKADEYIDMQNRIVRERLSGVRVVRAFNNDKKEHNRAKFATEEMAKNIIHSNVRSGFIQPVAMLLLNLATVLMLYVGALRVNTGKLEAAGNVIAVIQYVALIANAIISLSYTVAWLPKLKVSAKRIEEINSLPFCDVSADDYREEAAKKDSGASIEIKALSFKYNTASQPTLFDINMKIKGGENVAIIGGTGAGKSTLVKLLLAFYKPTSGEISIDGKPYSKLSKSEIRKSFSVCLQRGMIFEGSFRDNILIGNKDSDDTELLDVAECCDIRELIQSYDEGLSYTLVGMGQNISGGQKQRTNMSRTVIKDAPVYIFDDSFSALDFLTERKIQSRLKKRLAGKTAITITQRISTAIAADKIFVMEAGRIVGEGRHEELLLTCPIYREIAVSQLGLERIQEAAKR